MMQFQVFKKIIVKIIKTYFLLSIEYTICFIETAHTHVIWLVEIIVGDKLLQAAAAGRG